MKKALAVFAALAVMASTMHAAPLVNVLLSVGQLEDQFGNPVADGTTIQILADTGGDGFGTPTFDAFSSDVDDIVLLELALDSSTFGGQAGSHFAFLADFDFGAAGAAAGQDLMVQWFPSLPTSATEPGYDQAWGQFTLAGSDANWTIPASGQITLNVLDENNGGLAANTMTDGVTEPGEVIPEPSTALLVGFSLMSLSGLIRRRK